MIALLTEQSIKSRDIFKFWKTLFKQELDKDGIYTASEYFDLWAEDSTNDRLVSDVEKLVYSDSKHIDAILSLIDAKGDK